MTGRPTMLDDLRARRIFDAVEAGATRRAAAEAAGISRSTLQEWIARGKQGDMVYVDFADRIKKAEAVAENEMVGVVRDAAKKGTWQAAAWWLERRRPKTYALRRNDLKGIKPLSEEDANRLLEEASKLYAEMNQGPEGAQSKSG